MRAIGVIFRTISKPLADVAANPVGVDEELKDDDDEVAQGENGAEQDAEEQDDAQQEDELIEQYQREEEEHNLWGDPDIDPIQPGVV